MTDGLPPEGDDEVEAPRVMLVRVGEERLAVPLTDLREVLRSRPVTRVAGTAEWIRGLVTVRGALVPVGDLVRLVSPYTTDEAPWLLLVERDGRQAAFGVSAVEGVQPVAEPLATPMTGGTLPRSGAVRLPSQGSGGAVGVPEAADVLDVGALFEELFEGD